MLKGYKVCKCFEETEFPCLRTNKDGLIVLFTSRGVGTVVVAVPDYGLGWYNDCWSMSYFSDYAGDVCITKSGKPTED
jgi:hypothetical protein